MNFDELAATKRLLAKFRIRVTFNRLRVLHTLMVKAHAVSHADLEKEILDIDRVTLYRTLNVFIDKGIVHKVPHENGTLLLAISSAVVDPVQNQNRQNEHVHFKCLKCLLTRCVASVPIPAVQLPEGFIFHNSNYLISGICNTCNSAAPQ
jgi:Fur family transcriptional regulator, ferric uptake regulator